MIMSRRRKAFAVLIFILFSTFSLLVPKYAMVNTPGGITPGGTLEEDSRFAFKVIDGLTQTPIEGAFVTSGNEVVRTDPNGMGSISVEGNRVGVRALGYSRAEMIIPPPPETEPVSLAKGVYLFLQEELTGRTEKAIREPKEISLVPFTPKGLYLSFYGVEDRSLRESALKLIQETELNALVIDVKGDRGMIPYKSAIPLASEVGGQKIITVRDMAGLMKSFKESGIYTIARIVVFKDNLLAQKMPEWAVKTQNGQIWRDREGLAWVDPFKREVWDYNISIAVEAARLGFDEVQFDYVRFPDASAPHFSMPNTQENRVQAISGFLTEARKGLVPHNVFLSADIFGYVCWNLNDTLIGQTLDHFLPHVDYLAPMLYPSGFQYGIPGYRIPTSHPYEIVYLTLKRARERTGVSSVRFRPWLQAFRDYAFDRRSFEDKEIRDQINASEKFGSHGWMLWNPRNSYSTSGLKKEGPPKVALRQRGRSPQDPGVGGVQ